MPNLFGYSAFNNPTDIGAKILGTLGEKTVIRDAVRAGYRAHRTRTQKTGDVVVIDPATGFQLNVEVKTSFRGSDGRFQFCLYRQLKQGRVCTDHSYSQLVVLLAVEDDMSYTVLIIPANQLTGKKMSLGNIARSKYAGFVRSSLVL